MKTAGVKDDGNSMAVVTAKKGRQKIEGQLFIGIARILAGGVHFFAKKS